MNKNILRITYAGLLIALAVVLTRLVPGSVNFMGQTSLRLNLGYIPIMLSGILLGPFFGGLVGIGADFIGFFINSGGGTYFPGFTLTSALVGILPSLIIFKARQNSILLVSAVFITTICSCLLGTLWLTNLYGYPYSTIIIPRLVLSIIMFPIYTFFIYSIKKVLEKSTKIQLY